MKASTTKQILNFIIREKSQGNPFQELNIQMKILMKGVNVKGILEETITAERLTPLTDKLRTIAKEFDVDLHKMEGYYCHV